MKLFRLKALSSIYILLFLSVLLIMPGVKAQSNSLQISPVKTSIDANAGDKKQVIITLKNIGTTTANYNAVFNDFTASDAENGEPKIILDDTASPQGLKSWLTGPASVSLKGGTTSEYALTMSIPAGTKPGTYYGLVRFASGTETSVASLLFVNVGKITEQVAIEEIDTSAVHVDDAGQASGKFAVRIKNTGNGYTIPKLKIEILNDKKAVIETIDANKDAGGILSNGSIRKYTADFSSRLEPNKTYSAKVTATAGDSKPVSLEKTFIEAPVSTSGAAQNTTQPKTKNNSIVLLVAGASIALLMVILAVALPRKKKHKLTTMPAPAPQQPTGQQPFPPTARVNDVTSGVPVSSPNPVAQNEPTTTDKPTNSADE